MYPEEHDQIMIARNEKYRIFIIAFKSQFGFCKHGFPAKLFSSKSVTLPALVMCRLESIPVIPALISLRTQITCVSAC